MSLPGYEAMSEKPPDEIWTLAQSHDVKLVPTAGLPKYVLAREETKMNDSKPPDAIWLHETAWLVEFSEGLSATPTYWGRTIEGLGFTTENLDALRFAREQDAILFIEDSGWTEARAVQHAWTSPDDLKVIEAEPTEKRIAELDHLLRESQEQTRVQAVVYEGRERRDKARIAELEAQVTNQISTIEGLKHMDAMTCGCKYNKVWMGTKWEYYFIGCKEHGKDKIAKLEAQVEAEQKLADDAIEEAKRQCLQKLELEAELAKERETTRELLEALDRAKAGEKGA
jgi:hypothetical protein